MTQELIIGTHGQISTYLGLIPGRSVSWEKSATDAEAALQRMVITDEESAGRASAFVKAVGNLVKEAETERKRYTGPIDILKSTIVSFFSTSQERLEVVKKAANIKLTQYMLAAAKIAEEKRAVEAEAERKAAEALAATARAAGDEAGAEEIEAIAGKLDQVEKVVVRSEYGTSAGLQATISGQLSGAGTRAAFFVWASENLSVDDLEQITVSKRLLNKLAKAAHEAGKTVPGLEIIEGSSARVV
jgi:hypothetical protein